MSEHGLDVPGDVGVVCRHAEIAWQFGLQGVAAECATGQDEDRDDVVGVGFVQARLGRDPGVGDVAEDVFGFVGEVEARQDWEHS